MTNKVTYNVQSHNRGILAGRDIKDANLINTGDVSGSYNAIGVGARVVINQIQQARSAVAELTDAMRLAETQLTDAIARKIEQLTGAVEQAAQLNRRNPYRSLLDYKLEDAPYFYGRDQAIGDLLARIHSSRLTVLHAESGAGKSSLLQAGLAARLLAAGHLPLHLRPYDQAPSAVIKRALLPNLASLPELARFGEMSLLGFLDLVDRYLGESTLYLFLDQFEEFFVERNREQQTHFANELADCLDAAGLDVRWVLSLRKEYFADLNLFAPRIAPFANEYFLAAFQPAEARKVIVEPARKNGVAYESDGLVDQIVTDLRNADGRLQPPQVQLVCYELFEEAAASERPDLISVVLYNKPRGRNQSGAQGILSHHLSRVLERMPAHDRKLARQILEMLVSSQTRRARVAHTELSAQLQQRHPSLAIAQMDGVLNQLLGSRLLRSDENEDDIPIFELAHDYLLADIEVDPELLAQKAAQEMLKQEVSDYARFGTLLNKEKFDIVNSQRTYLLLDDMGIELLTRSDAMIRAGERERAAEQQRTLMRTRLALLAALIALVFASIAAYPTVRNELRRLDATNQGKLVRFDESEANLGDNKLYAEGYAMQEASHLVPRFGLEATEVTIRRFLLCVEANKCSPPNVDASAYQLPEQADYPVTNITAFQADAFCTWLGRRLPTEIEWERAARNLDGRAWPWGADMPKSAEYANLAYQYPKSVPLAPVGAAHLGHSIEGVYDLVGNAWEWTSTPSETQNPEAAELILKGGSVSEDASTLENTMAIHLIRPRNYFHKDIGFRCAGSR
ncbi:MAG: SUMF1/EgtB/PvdO family nonheme iron enzyme [Caldilineaceae bacterium]|nr:SUMF1/EgtB/PvdO family nonheme iron enzyme [Caldilineaceae bacterium]